MKRNTGVGCSWVGMLTVHMGTEPGKIQVKFAFPLPPDPEKQLPPRRFLHHPSVPVRRSLNARTMGWDECQERGDNCQEVRGTAAKTSIPTHGKEFLQTQLKVALPPNVLVKIVE